MKFDSRALREMLASATPGPWSHRPADADDYTPAQVVHPGWEPGAWGSPGELDGPVIEYGQVDSLTPGGGVVRPEDLELIVAAVNALPTLLHALDAYRRVIDGTIRQWRDGSIGSSVALARLQSLVWEIEKAVEG